MDASKNQKIIVLTTLEPSDNQLILNGIKLASIFKKELCLVFHYKKRKSNKKSEFREKLQEYSQRIKKEIPEQKISTLLANESLSNLPEYLADNYEAILIVANTQYFRKLSSATAETPVPFVFVHPESKIIQFDRLVQPIDLRKENSDCALWCSYFGRFNGAEIVSVAAKDSSNEGKQNVNRNADLTKKLYNKFDISHKVYRGTRSSLRVAFEAMELALASDCNLFVLLGSSSLTPLDYLIGLPERKLIKQAGKLPVLFINPKRDNYILCD